MVYVELDGKQHDLLEGGVNTRCGLDVPYGSPYTPQGSAKPDGPFCTKCFPDEKASAKTDDAKKGK